MVLAPRDGQFILKFEFKFDFSPLLGLSGKFSLKQLQELIMLRRQAKQLFRLGQKWRPGFCGLLNFVCVRDK